MGDIAFNIDSNVNINKVVDWDIDKNVNANVDNPDQLATAQSDAEAFGTRALAETDTYTYVSEGEPRTLPTTAPGQTDAEGGTTELELGLDADGDGAADTIVVNFTPPPQEQQPDGTFLPDVDDINGLGSLTPLNAPPPPLDQLPDAPLPVVDLFEITDLNLTQTGPLTSSGANQTALYESTADWEVDYGIRELDLGKGLTEDTLLLNVPEGTEFLVTFLESGAVEVEFDDVASESVFIFDDKEFELTRFTLEAASLELDTIGEWNFNAASDFFHPGTGGGGGEAFSYSESIAALDLNGDDSVIPSVETEI